MRLTCPNCEAQYEIPDEVMSQAGRDVQCSDCGQTWFQHHPDNIPEESETTAQSVADTDRPGSAVEPASKLDPDHVEAGTTEPPRQELDPVVANILRKEAETETLARSQSHSDPLESQPDLGLPESDKPNQLSSDEKERHKADASQRMARLRGKPEPMSDAELNAAAISSRRDLLPDIEEINSTLRTEGESTVRDGQAEIEGPTERKRRSGFRRGVLLMIVIFVILALIYIYAPRISEAVPQLDGALTAYVAWVDQLRVWLDGKVQSFAQWLDAKASESSGS